MKNTMVAIVAFFLGAVISAFVVKYRYDETLLWGLYIKSASEIDSKLVTLDELRQGNKERAIHLLDQSLASEATVLAGCKRDLCQDNAYPAFTKALKKAEAYEKKYNVK